MEVFLRKTESPKAVTEAQLWAIDLRPKTGVRDGFGNRVFPKPALRRFGPQGVRAVRLYGFRLLVCLHAYEKEPRVSAV